MKTNRVKYELIKIIYRSQGDDGSISDIEYDPLTEYNSVNLNAKNLEMVDKEGRAEIGRAHFTYWNITIKDGEK